jgi:uncharacterized membrane protein
MSEGMWVLSGTYVVMNFLILIITIQSFNKSYRSWKTNVHYYTSSLIKDPDWTYMKECETRATRKTTYYRRLKKVCFWLSPILLFTLIPIYLLFFIKECFVWIYETYKD